MANIKRANTSGITKSGVAIPDVPDAPTIGAANNVGTSRAFNNGSATVAFTAAATGGTSTSFTATSTPGGFTASGAGSPLTVTGLQSATSYTFAVTGTNTTATGAASAASSSITATTVPATPSAPTATDAGSGRSFNNGSASVAFTEPATGGAAISSYTVTSSPGGFTGTGSSSPITVTGQQSATAYTYTITATNANGTSSASSASGSVTATTVPQAPTIGTATAGSASATVTYTANATGGAAVSTFTATSSPGGLTGTGASPITVSGLTNGTAYTFTVTATNANGTSTASSASNSVTPVVPKAGFFAGGLLTGTSSTIDKVTFSNDSRSTLSSTLEAIKIDAAGFANSGTAGYVAGGIGSFTTGEVSIIPFATESRSTVGYLSTIRDGVSGMANSGTAGYVAGGFNTTVIQKLAFSNNSISTIGATLRQARYYGTSWANSGTAGYIGAGNDGNGNNGTFYSTVDKLTFSNDSRSNMSPTLVNSNNTAKASMANSGTAGYVNNGNTSMNKWAFSSDTTSTFGTGTIMGREGMADSGIAGYWGGGHDGLTRNGDLHKVTFSNDSYSFVGSLPSTGGRSAGFANSNNL
jgi:trimeric autotransporter adhesin